MAEITLASLTEQIADGQGYFDSLMRAAKSHLEEEYNKNRIKGAEYATVYLGTIQAVLDKAMQFALERQTADKQADLISAQVVNEGKRGNILDAELLNIPKQGLILDYTATKTQREATNLEIQGQLLDAQKDSELKRGGTNGLIARQTSKTYEEALLTIAQREYLESQKATEDKNTELVAQQKTNLISEELRIDAQTALLGSQKATEDFNTQLTDAQERLLELQILLETQRQTTDDYYDQETCKLKAEYELLTAQKAKVEAEDALLDQKKVTETAQTTKNWGDNSMLAKQAGVLQAQTDGFARDAEQKAAKIATDAFNVFYTFDADVHLPNDAGLSNTDIKNYMDKLIAGIS